MTIDLDKVRPMSEWVFGTFTVVLASGGVWERHMSAATADHVRRNISGGPQPDVIRWDDSWIAFNPDHVAGTSWRRRADCGAALTAEQRAEQVAAGHHHGYLATVFDLWEGEDEPKYSLHALLALSAMSQTLGPGAEFANYARTYEGAEGADRAKWEHERAAHAQAADKAAARRFPVPETEREESPQHEETPAEPAESPATPDRTDSGSEVAGDE